MRKLVGIVAAIVIIFTVAFACEWVAASIAPPPHPGPIRNDEIAVWLATAPIGAKLMVVLGWFLGVLIGAWAALRIAGWYPIAWIVAGISIILCVANLFIYPHPWWMQGSAIALPVAGGWIATRLPWRTGAARPDA